jgi:hypothetical protein
MQPLYDLVWRIAGRLVYEFVDLRTVFAAANASPRASHSQRRKCDVARCLVGESELAKCASKVAAFFSIVSALVDLQRSI